MPGARPSRAMGAGCAAVSLLLATTACGADEPADRTLRAEDLGLTAVAEYGRHAAVSGTVDVRLTNAGGAVVELVHVQLRSPLYATVPAAPRASTLPPGDGPRIVPMAFGAVRCEASDAALGDVLLGVRTEQGVVEVAVPLADGETGLVRAHRLACAVASAAEAATLSLGPTWTRVEGPERPLLRTTLRAVRKGAAAVEVTQLLRNILFDVAVPAGDPLLALPAGEREAEVAVELSATRCDPHALTESKTSFTFPHFVRLDGGEEVAAPLTVEGPGRAALQALLDDTCGAP